MAFKARNRRTVWVDIFSFKLYIKVFRMLETFLLFCEQVNLSFQFYMALGSEHPGKVSKTSLENISFRGISLNQYFQFRIESISTYTKPAENDFHRTSFHISSTPKILTATCCFDLKGRVAWSGITPRGWIKQEIIKVKVSLSRKKQQQRFVSVM